MAWIRESKKVPVIYRLHSDGRCIVIYVALREGQFTGFLFLYNMAGNMKQLTFAK